MKGVLSTLIVLAIFSGLLATFLVPLFIAQHQFRVREPWSVLIGAGSLALTLFGLYRWLLHLQRKERKVLGTSHYPIFGEVQRLKDHWEASVPLSEGGPRIDIWGEALEPIATQVSTFNAIRDRYPEFLALTIEHANAVFDSLGIVVLAEDLRLDSIHLPEGAFGSFSLTFSASAHQPTLPWGISATFRDFVVDEISDNH